MLPRTSDDDKPFSAHGLYHRDDNFGSQCNGLQRVSRVKTVKLLHSQVNASDFVATEGADRAFFSPSR
jgi:hypothetical protein